MDQQRDDTQGEGYPRGRGYGHDYMRGGEVFGGYGYSTREDYDRPRGELREKTTTSTSEAGTAPEEAENAEEDPEPLDADAGERFPQDERAGRWEVPNDLGGEQTITGSLDAATLAVPDSNNPPVPQIERTFGDTGGNRLHSKSYYVTQAQLQQRLYALKSERGLDTPGTAKPLAPEETKPS